jgi:hypothetical protein
MVVTPPSRSMSHTLPTKGIGQGPPSSACQPILHHREQTKKKKKHTVLKKKRSAYGWVVFFAEAKVASALHNLCFKKDGAND